MTILLYDNFELDERSSRSLRVWKAWHLVLYVFAAVFGIVNYVFLQNTMELVEGNCVLFPRELEFHMVDISDIVQLEKNNVLNNANENAFKNNGMNETNAQVMTDAVPTEHDNVTDNVTGNTGKTKRDLTNDNKTDDAVETMTADDNVTIIVGNSSHRLMLDTSRTLFGSESDCQFAEYMPIMSTIVAAVWITLFTMCPGGGRVRTGLQQPWSILAPAVIFALVMVGLTGYSFTQTNGGLFAFCSAFYEITNSTTCSAASSHVELSWRAAWGLSGRAAASRAASAGVWAAWACAAALLLARCLAAPDFQLRRVGVHLTKDPHQKITPYLKKNNSRRSRSSQSSPSKRDNVSVRSEPTVTTELVAPSLEQGQDTAPSSLNTTPLKMDRKSDIIEMAYTPQERLEHP